MKPGVWIVVGLLLGTGCACATPPQTVWLTLGEPAWQLLERIDPGVRPRAVRPLQRNATLAVENVRVVQVSLGERNRLAAAVHRQLHHCGGFVAHRSLADALAWLAPAPLAFTPTRPSYVIAASPQVLPMLADVSASRIGSEIRALSAFQNRYYDSVYGAQAADWLANQWQTIAAGRSDIHVDKVYYGNAAMPSVVLSIDGTALSDQVLVLGAHLDSINWQDRGGLPLGQGRAPGADDDASGVAGLTEVLRVLVAHGFQPQRSIRLMAYTGEENGLYGSGQLASDYASRKVDVVGVLQLDMTNYQGSTADIVLVDDSTDAQQNAFLEDLVAYYLPDLDTASTNCGYACSDHASWTQRGYAASFPFEAVMGQDNPYFHSSQDTWASSGSQALHARKFTRLALAWLLELAGEDGVIFADGFD